MHARWILLPAAALAGTTSGYATTYLTIEQAQAALLPGTPLTAVPVKLAATERAGIERACGLRVRAPELRAWRTPEGGWFLVDDVLGKHEFITYAVAITPGGTVSGIEILDYRETYGEQIRGPAWRRQFVGKSSRSPLKLDEDIKNISGATLSSRHVTDGVKRLLATYEIALRHRR